MLREELNAQPSCSFTGSKWLISERRLGGGVCGPGEEKLGKQVAGAKITYRVPVLNKARFLTGELLTKPSKFDRVYTLSWGMWVWEGLKKKRPSRKRQPFTSSLWKRRSFFPSWIAKNALRWYNIHPEKYQRTGAILSWSITSVYVASPFYCNDRTLISALQRDLSNIRVYIYIYITNKRGRNSASWLMEC